jgi:RND family efflux transporter MFP subunit
MLGLVRPASILAPALTIISLLGGCDDSNQYVAPPPPTVTVATPEQRKITPYLETTGSTSAVNQTNLVARVQGYVEDIKYKDGSFITKGTTLFVIEPEPYRVRLEQAKAAKAGAEASLKQLEADFQRQSDLVKRQVVSRSTLDAALAARDSAQSKLDQAALDIRQAEINLGYTEVKAPFDGIVTARKVSVGELVGAGSTTVLATITQIDPIYVNFTIAETDVVEAREQLRKAGETVTDLIGKLPIEVGLQTDKDFPIKGVLDYAAPFVDQSTGTLALRGIFQNPKRKLLPGYFVRVRVPMSNEPNPVLMVPDIALGSDQSGRYVLVVNADNIVEQRKVEIGAKVDDMRVVSAGLKPDDRVVVAGLLRAVPGQKVDPQMQAHDSASRTQ